MRQLNTYYARMVKEIDHRNRREAQGTGGDVAILLSVVRHLLEEPWFITYIWPDGTEMDIVPGDIKPKDTIELRSGGPGWKWHDKKGNEWVCVSAASIEELPRWFRKE